MKTELKDVLDNYLVEEWHAYSAFPYGPGDSEGIKKCIFGITGDPIPSLRFYQLLRDDMKLPQLAIGERWVEDPKKTALVRQKNKWAKPVQMKEEYIYNNLFSHGSYNMKDGSLPDLLEKKSIRVDLICIVKYNNTTNVCEVVYLNKGDRFEMTREVYEVLNYNYEQQK